MYIGKGIIAKPAKRIPPAVLEKPPLVNKQRDQENDEEDILFVETDTEINTP